MAVQMQRSFLSRPRPEIERFKFSRYESIDEIMTPPITPTTPISPKEYDILSATIEDKEDILNFLREFFYKDEPLNKYLGLITTERPICKDLEEFSLHDIDNGLNVKAVYNGKIIGVSLNAILERDIDQPFLKLYYMKSIHCSIKYDKLCSDHLVGLQLKEFLSYIEEEDYSSSITDPKFSKITRMLDYVAKESDIFSRFPDSDKAMTVKIVSVNDAFRGQGIGKELMNRTRDIARESGCGFMSVDCSSHFTALALKKLGFELHYSLKYADYRENGQVVFKPEPPHEAVTVYVQKI